MSSQDEKAHPCPHCGGEGRLLVDVETETIPHRDAAGHKQYHCINCQKRFAVDEQGNVVDPHAT